MCFVPGSVLSIVHILTHLRFTHCNYPYITYEEIEAQRDCDLSRSSQWQSQDESINQQYSHCDALSR